MPNLQQWLNAWVKVNTKQGNGPSSIGPPGHGGNGPRSPQSRERSGTSSGRNRSSSIGSQSERKSEHAVRVKGTSSANSARLEQLLHFTSHTMTSSNSEEVTLSSNTTETGNNPNGAPANGNPEHTAIRKFNSRKHRRRLNRTNSFSDLLREKAKHRSSRSSGRHYSVERPHYAGPGEANHHDNSKQRRRSSFNRANSNHSSSSNRHRHRRSNPPPPTLHHMVEPPPSHDDDLSSEVDEEEEAYSRHSISPTETATTIVRSNVNIKQRFLTTTGSSSQRFLVKEDSQEEIESSKVLFGVADFFGTDISDLRAPERPTTASTAARHQTHKAQHGLEDEQPHYLRAYKATTNTATHKHSHHPAYAPPPTYHSNNHSTRSARTIATLQSNSSSLRSLFEKSNSAHQPRSSLTQGGGGEPATPTSTRKAASFSYPQPLPNNAPTTTNNEQGKTEPSKKPPTPDNSSGGFVMGGVRLPFFATNNDTNVDSSATATRTRTSNTDTEEHEISFDTTTTNNNTGNERGKKNSDPGRRVEQQPDCPNCQIAKLELRRTQESLEYMRTMAIRKEFTCQKCGSTSSTKSPPAEDDEKKTQSPTEQGDSRPIVENGDVAPSAAVKSSSQQLVEVTGRHKKQVEQLMKERNHWQQNMHLKLEKFSNLCHSRNDESSQHAAESQALKDQLEAIRAERDQMASELVPLRTAVQEFDNERLEHRLVKERMARYETEGLRHANAAIAQRDEMIAKLSSRLETALDTLAAEREQQRQRRQIIFPQQQQQTQQPASKGSVNDHAMNGDVSGAQQQQQDELERLRAELLATQQRLETVQLEAHQRETALRFKCETLENQIKKNNNRPATTTDSSSGSKPHEPHPLFS